MKEVDANLAVLNANFGMPGVLAFEQTASGLVYAEVTTVAARATVYLQGAHLTAWEPAGLGQVMFLSRRSEFEKGKAIRGGVPLAFPWFAVDQKQDRVDGKPGPSHGFARIEEWTLAFAAMAGDDLHLTFTLGPTGMSRSMGFDHFKLVFRLGIGRSLTMELTVANEANEPLVFEEAMHTYFKVVNVREVSVTGLEPTGFIDKADGLKVKPAAGVALRFDGVTDRLFPDTSTACSIHDPAAKRTITNAKTNSDTTVVFNPWKAMADLGEDEWPEMLCVETVNAGVNAVTLEPGKTHTMTAHISVEPIVKVGG